jgi:hypothetical protein
MGREFLMQKVEYWRPVKAPTLAQYLIRRAVREVMTRGHGLTGVGIDQDSGRPIPVSAQAAKMRMKGVTAEQLAQEHPEWVEDYRNEYKLLEK